MIRYIHIFINSVYLHNFLAGFYRTHKKLTQNVDNFDPTDLANSSYITTCERSHVLLYEAMTFSCSGKLKFQK